MQHIIMSSCKYDNFQLYRTSPKLSGNMQWDIIVEPDGASFKVVGFHLRPLCKSTPYAPLAEENILVRPHQNNIKIFHDAIESSFYSYDSELDNDQYIYVPKGCDKDVKYNKRWDDQFWAGTQRMDTAIYGYTHETLIPVWIESCRSLKIYIDMVDGENMLASYELNLCEPENTDTIHEKFCKYFIDYLKYCAIYCPEGENIGNNNCMSVDLENNLTTITGIDASRGVFVTKNNYDIARNLISRERPLLEANSILTNAFQEADMITHQLINFNLIFNPSSWVGSEYSKNNPRNFEIQSYVYINGEPCERRDIFTNHHFIPRPIVRSIQTRGSDPDKYSWLDYTGINALDYKRDYLCTDIIHANKIVQPICHWSITGSDVLFNLYDGFGCTYKNHNGIYKTLEHSYDMSTNLADLKYNDEIHNDAWVTPVMIAGENYIKKSINDVKSMNDLQNHRYLRPLSDSLGGNIFNYTKSSLSEPDDIYIGITKQVVLIGSGGVALETEDDDNDASIQNLDYVDIWIERGDGKRLLSYGEVINDIGDAISTGAEFLDMNKRWDVYTGKSAAVQANIRCHGLRLYIANKSIADNNGGHKNILFVIANTREFVVDDYNLRRLRNKWIEDNDDEPKMKSFALGTPVGDLDSYRFAPWCLCVAGFIRSISLYTDYYESKIKSANDGQYPTELLMNKRDLSMLENLILLRDVLNNIKVPKTIKFDKSIQIKQDNSISDKALEVKYVKKNHEANSYVTRCSADIRPAMFKPAIKRTLDNKLKYYHKFGRNFLWLKDYSDNCIHYYGDASPKYPSLSYDSVIQSSSQEIESTYILMLDLDAFMRTAAYQAVPNEDATIDYSKIDLAIEYITDLYNSGIPIINVGEEAVRNAMTSNQPRYANGTTADQYHRVGGADFFKESVMNINNHKSKLYKAYRKFESIKDIIKNINDSAKYYVGTEDDHGAHYRIKWLDRRASVPELILSAGAPRIEYIPISNKELNIMLREYNEGYKYINGLFDLNKIIKSGIRIHIGISYHLSPTFNPDGDLIYDEPIPIYSGMTERDVYSSKYRDRYCVWPEYKWFNKSKIRLLPRTFRMEYNDIYSESKQVLDDKIVGDFINYTKQSDLDPDYVKKIYNINYEFLKIIRNKLTSNIRYSYLVTMRLK